MSKVRAQMARDLFASMGDAVEFGDDELNHLALADRFIGDALPSFVVSATISHLIVLPQLDDLCVDERLAVAERVMILATRADGEAQADSWNYQHVRILRAVIKDWPLPEEWFRKTARILGSAWASEERPDRTAA